MKELEKPVRVVKPQKSVHPSTMIALDKLMPTKGKILETKRRRVT